jgi:hypothetical protein
MGHAFKVGLGKALGMGSVRSSIRRIWVRRSDTYQWEVHDIHGDPELALGCVSPAISKAVATLKEVQNKLNLLEDGWRERTLHFPTAGLHYWNDFNNPAGPRAGKNTKGGAKGGGQHKQWQDRGSGGSRGESSSGHFSNTMRIKPPKQGK